MEEWVLGLRQAGKVSIERDFEESSWKCSAGILKMRRAESDHEMISILTKKRSCKKDLRHLHPYIYRYIAAHPDF